MFTIGPFARLAGVSAKVLRSYDALGLFRPVWVDPATDYRYYSPAQLPELRRIVSLRDMGIGLAEIGRLISGGGDLRSALDRRRVELERERREIDRRLATLDIRVEMSAAGSEQPDIVVRPLAGRRRRDAGDGRPRRRRRRVGVLRAGGVRSATSAARQPAARRA